MFRSVRQAGMPSSIVHSVTCFGEGKWTKYTGNPCGFRSPHHKTPSGKMGVKIPNPICNCDFPEGPASMIIRRALNASRVTSRRLITDTAPFENVSVGVVLCTEYRIAQSFPTSFDPTRIASSDYRPLDLPTFDPTWITSSDEMT